MVASEAMTRKESKKVQGVCSGGKCCDLGRSKGEGREKRTWNLGREVVRATQYLGRRRNYSGGDSQT